MVVHCAYYTYRPFRHGRQQYQKHIFSRQHCRNPRPPQGGRPDALALNTVSSNFLSTPSARRATAAQRTYLAIDLFLSTPSARRATVRPVLDCRPAAFLSTPSVRRATSATMTRCLQTSEFLSTPSVRRATCLRSFSPGFEKFLSTPSVRRATGPTSSCLPA